MRPFNSDCYSWVFCCEPVMANSVCVLIPDHNPFDRKLIFYYALHSDNNILIKLPMMPGNFRRGIPCLITTMESAN